MNFLKITLLVLLTQALPSFAEAASTGSSEKIEKINAVITERFAKADVDKDGTLTLDEAKSGMPRVAKEYTAIDTAGTGKITAEQIKTHMDAAYGGK
jgi:hypothetical protein